MSRVLLATHSFPPAPGGTPTILYNLLRHFPGDCLVVFHQRPGRVGPVGQRLPFVTQGFALMGSPRLTEYLGWHAPRLVAAIQRRRIRTVARRHAVKRIYAHYPDICCLVASWLAARDLDLPLTVYFDVLCEEGSRGPQQELARRCERAVVQYADQRFAITEFAVGYLGEKHGLTWNLLPHAVDTAGIQPGLAQVPQGTAPTVHFAGTIYPRMNQDAVERLISAAERANCHPLIDLCTVTRVSYPSHVKCRYLDSADLLGAQRQSDVLFLPLAFDSTSPEMIRTNLPTKIVEYLVSGRPIIVHAPADCYLTWLAKRHGFALVVDQPDVDALARALDQVVQDTELQRELVDRAQAFARTRDSVVLSRQLRQALFGDVEELPSSGVPPEEPCQGDPIHTEGGTKRCDCWLSRLPKR